MRNLANIDTEQVETLPTRDKVRSPDSRRHGWWTCYPYKKVQNFLAHRVGKNWNDVFSEYVHLDWVPDQHKTREQIGHEVYVNTFIGDDGKVWVYEKYGSDARPVDNLMFGNYVFYVHPETKKLCYLEKKVVDYKKKQAEEQSKYMRVLGDYHQLLKVKGVWFEVKAEPIPSNVVEVNGLHYRYVKENAIEKHDFKLGVGVKVLDPHDAGYIRINGRLAVPCTLNRDYAGSKPLGPKDCLLEMVERNHPYWRRDYDSVKVKVYRQLNHKDLKKYGLKNDRLPVIGVRCKKCGGIVGIDCLYHVCMKCYEYVGHCKCI